MGFTKYQDAVAELSPLPTAQCTILIDEALGLSAAVGDLASMTRQEESTPPNLFDDAAWAEGIGVVLHHLANIATCVDVRLRDAAAYDLRMARQDHEARQAAHAEALPFSESDDDDDPDDDASASFEDRQAAGQAEWEALARRILF
jgi:hypothetical protein